MEDPQPLRQDMAPFRHSAEVLVLLLGVDSVLLRLWRVPSGQPRRPLPPQAEVVHSVSEQRLLRERRRLLLPSGEGEGSGLGRRRQAGVPSVPRRQVSVLSTVEFRVLGFGSS